MLVIDPDRGDPDLDPARSPGPSRYLGPRGDGLYAGGQYQMNPFYGGLWRERVRRDHPTHTGSGGGGPTRASGRSRQPSCRSQPRRPEGRDPKAAIVRRQTRVEVVEDATPPAGGRPPRIGHSEVTRFRLLARGRRARLARASTWDMAAFGRLDGKARTGLVDVEVARASVGRDTAPPRRRVLPHHRRALGRGRRLGRDRLGQRDGDRSSSNR